MITADGAHGDPDRAPFDRIIVTFAVTSVPPAWINQTRPAGVVLAPVFSGLVKLTVTSHGHAEGRFIGPGYFMRHRAIPEPLPNGVALREQPVVAAESPCPQRSTELPASVYYDNDFRFILDLTMPRLTHSHPGKNLNDLILSAPDGSQAHVTADGDLTQSGPRRLWNDIDTIHQTWRALDAPPRERFGLTVEPDHQTIWLDAPDSSHRWPIAELEGCSATRCPTSFARLPSQHRRCRAASPPDYRDAVHTSKEPRDDPAGSARPTRRIATVE